MPKVLITDHPWPSIDIETEILRDNGIEVIDSPADDEATLSKLAADVDAIATCWAKVFRPVIDAAPNCRHIARMGIGLDNIDVAYASERGIPVTNVPDYCIEEVADQAIGGLLGLARNVVQFDREIKDGKYDLAGAPPMRRLSTQTIGIVGFGRTGQAVADRAKSFGLKVLAWSKSGNNYGRGDVEMVPFEQILAECDYISVHVPLSDNTRHLFDAKAFSAMKPSAYLANTSRGPVIDQKALLDALNSGEIAGAALDVWDPEPPAMDDPLLQHPRLVATPHAAFVSVEALEELRRRVAHQIVAILGGKEAESVVNLAALSR